jgi:hypothetical protein
LSGLTGDPEAILKLKQHLQWESLNTVMEYVDHARGQQLDDAAERIFRARQKDFLDVPGARRLTLRTATDAGVT